MAVVSSSSQNERFSVAANELQDHIVDVYGNKENELELFRPSLADQQKVGFFTLDRCSQTEVTEVVELKDMTEVLQLLIKDVHKMKRDINLTKSLMQADYDAKVQEKSRELYCRINEKVTELERIHQNRVSTVRKAFKQQLADAVSRLAVLYNKNLETKMKREKQKQEGNQEQLDEKYKELQQTIQQDQNVITMLKMQLAQNQQTKIDIESSSTIMVKGKESKRVEGNEIESVSMRTPSPQFNQELEDLRIEVEDLNVKVTNLQNIVDIKEDENKNLGNQIETLTQELDQEKIKSDKEFDNVQISKELDNTKKSVEEERASSEKLSITEVTSKNSLFEPKGEVSSKNSLSQPKKKVSCKNSISQPTIGVSCKNSILENEVSGKKSFFQRQKKVGCKTYIFRTKGEVSSTNDISPPEEVSFQNDGMDKQRAEMEKMFQTKLQKAQEEAEANAQRESLALQSAEKEKFKLLQDQKKLLEEQLTRERKKNVEKSTQETDIDKYIKNEKRLKEEIDRLRREIERVHRTWEKKFAILQQSLHALKDESYIRHTLQRQAASLHHAAVGYAIDTPMGILPVNKTTSPMKKPVIPDIGKGKQQPPAPPQPATGQPLNVPVVLGEKDYISYTVSAPSGRGTAMFSVDENQVMSDGEQDDIPTDIQHLPDPPTRESHGYNLEGTPSEKHRKERLYQEGQKT